MNLYIILEMMEKKGITKTELAESLGISSYTLRTRFRKKTSFTIDEIKTIKELLDLSIEQINKIFFDKEVV